VTGVGDKRLLRASHIKPWRESNNGERLNGANGLMLSPHFDALFDLGLMSFEDNGTMLIRNDVAKDVIERWAIPRSREPKPFDLSQRPYLALHRERLDAIGAFRH
jgi:predicted restriction endonuclease